AAIEGKIHELQSHNAEMVAINERAIRSERDRQLFDEAKILRAGYWGALDDLLKTNRAGRNKEARALLLRLRPTFEKLTANADGRVAEKQRLGDAAGNAV